jgi:hypothetical protein
MHDQPEATEDEQELAQERQDEEEAMRAPGHDDPDRPAEEEREA